MWAKIFYLVWIRLSAYQEESVLREEIELIRLIVFNQLAGNAGIFLWS